jgi:hypothetical protein
MPSGSSTTFSPSVSESSFKADTLSLTAWQLGMYGFMAIASILIFQRTFVRRLDPGMGEFWFMMQIAMLCGFATRKGLKEKM